MICNVRQEHTAVLLFDRRGFCVDSSAEGGLLLADPDSASALHDAVRRQGASPQVVSVPVEGVPTDVLLVSAGQLVSAMVLVA